MSFIVIFHPYFWRISSITLNGSSWVWTALRFLTAFPGRFRLTPIPLFSAILNASGFRPI
jgi:hypothetical protein